MFHCDNQDHKNHDNLPQVNVCSVNSFYFPGKITVEMFNCSTTSLDLLYENKLLYLWEKYNTMQAKVSLVISFKKSFWEISEFVSSPSYI